MSTVRAISLGGGHQSTALVVLAVQKVIDFPLAIMANVGDRAENPATLAYLADHLMPYAEANGYEIVIRRWVTRNGVERDLFDDITSMDNRSIAIPVYMEGGAPGTRQCTARYKIDVVGRELRRRGASPENPAVVAVGFSTNEAHRANRRKVAKWERVEYPLLDLNMDVDDCDRVVRDAGLPVPPKSSCWFCPFQKAHVWEAAARAGDPKYEAGVALERRLNEKREMIDKDHVYLSPTKRPLDRILDQQALDLTGEGPDTCDNGSCWT